MRRKGKYRVTHSFFGVDGDRSLGSSGVVRDRGTFHVSDEDYPEFKMLYFAALREGAYLNVMERPRDFSMLCVDVDLKLVEKTRKANGIAFVVDEETGIECEKIVHFDQVVQNKFVTLEDAHKVHLRVIECLQELYRFDNEDVVGVLMQRRKKCPSSKDGFHILYPDVVLGEQW